MVDFDDDFGELGIADGEYQRLSSRLDTSIARRRLASWQPEFTVLDGDSAGRDRLGQGRKPRRQCAAVRRQDVGQGVTTESSGKALKSAMLNV